MARMSRLETSLVEHCLYLVAQRRGSLVDLHLDLTTRRPLPR